MKKLEEILNLPESKKTIKKAEREKSAEVAAPFLRDMSEFDKMTVWQHDAKPDIPHMRDCINWFEISSALHS